MIKMILIALFNVCVCSQQYGSIPAFTTLIEPRGYSYSSILPVRCPVSSPTAMFTVVNIPHKGEHYQAAFSAHLNDRGLLTIDSNYVLDDTKYACKIFAILKALGTEERMYFTTPVSKKNRLFGLVMHGGDRYDQIVVINKMMFVHVEFYNKTHLGIVVDFNF